MSPSPFETSVRVFGQDFGPAPSPDDAQTLEQAVLIYARLLDIQIEYAHYSRHPGACFLSAFGIRAPTQAEITEARDAVIAHAGDPRPTSGLAS